jgi:hypothetical protein
MKTHSFTLILEDIKYEGNFSISNALYGAGLSDTFFGYSNKQAMLMVDREASSSYEAVRTAILQVRKAGFEVQEVQVPPNWFGA